MKKKNAACFVDRTAERNERQGTSYLRATTMSTENLKEQIGELLFCLEFPIGKQLSQVGWGLFERLLRKYIELKYA